MAQAVLQMTAFLMSFSGIVFDDTAVANLQPIVQQLPGLYL